MIVVFVGLGNMGSGMAANLIKSDHVVRAIDPSNVAKQKAEAMGAQVFDDLDAALDGATVMITMLPSGFEVKHMAQSLGSRPRPGFLWMDCSTIDVETARLTHKAMAEIGIDFVDAPVSGGVSAALEGRLTFMVGALRLLLKGHDPI